MDSGKEPDMNKLLILGREPAALAGALQAVILVLATLLFNLSDNQAGAVALVAIGVLDLYVAYATKDTLLGVAVGLVKASVAAALAFGYTVDANTVALVVGAVTSLLGLAVQRPQTSPVADPPDALPLAA